MKIPKLRYSMDECVNKISQICSKSDVCVKRINKPDHVILQLASSDSREGMIRIYNSKKGRSLDGSQKDISLNDEILQEFYELYCSSLDSNILDKRAIFIIKSNLFDNIRQAIEAIAKQDGFTVSEQLDIVDTIYYLIRVAGEDENDRITITQFNSGKLLVQGKGWNTWDDVCGCVEKKLNYSVKEMLVRFMSSETNTDIANIITTSLVKDAETKVKERLGASYDFLYEHDKKLIVSSQAQLLAKVDYGDYYCYVAPILKAVEGYLIKVVVSNSFYTETEILARNTNGKPKFNFSSVFDVPSKRLHVKHKNLLLNTSTTIDDKEKAFLYIYDRYTWVRSPFFHDGPPPIEEVNTYEDAESIFDEIIVMISSTYNILTN